MFAREPSENNENKQRKQKITFKIVESKCKEYSKPTFKKRLIKCLFSRV